MKAESKSNAVPAWLKWAYTAFLAVLVPIYWVNYGPTNFLYFCDVALLLTLLAIWTERPLYASMAAVGILLPQFFWCVDYVCGLLGMNLSGMTGYMFNVRTPLHLRALSLFHGWLPFLLVFLVARLGYDRRGLAAWSGTATGLCLVSFFLLPAPGSVPPGSNIPVNVNYVFGLSDLTAQTWMAPGAYLVVWIGALALLAWVPVHLVLTRWCGRGEKVRSGR